MKTSIRFFEIFFALLCAALLPNAEAVNPPPDGGYPGFNTAEGQKALFSLTTGAANTAVGWYSLFSNAEGSFNTATGAGALLLYTANENTAFGAAALLFNTDGSENTAVGAAALVNNTTGSDNTANGFFALQSNMTGNANTAIGAATLQNNTEGFANTASGKDALHDNTTGNNNTATGHSSLLDNVNGGSNTANGAGALAHNTTGDGNTANGDIALVANTTGEFNTAIGTQALQTNVSGDANSAIGHSAGFYVTGSGNVCVGADVLGTAGQNNTTRIRNIGSTPIIDGITVVIGSTGGVGDGILGYPASSRRYKVDIKPMDKASETLFALKPVTFRAKGNIDPGHAKHYGLIAEDVAAVDSDLVVYNPEGKPETLCFNSINAMLLNEFLKEHKRVEELKSAMAQQRKETEALVARLNKQEARIQKVSAQVEMRKSGSQMLVENQ